MKHRKKWKKLYPYLDTKQGSEGVNFFAIVNLLGVPFVVVAWLLWAGGGIDGLFGRGVSEIIPTVGVAQPTSTLNVSADLLAGIFDAAVVEDTQAPPASGRMITSVPSATPTPTPDLAILSNYGWTARGCNTAFPGFERCGNGENCVFTGDGWVICDNPTPDFSTFPTAVPTVYFITITPTPVFFPTRH